MADYKIISVRLRTDEDAGLIAYLTRSGSPASQIRELWKKTRAPKKKRPGAALENTVFQLKHVIERCDTDLLLKNMTEEEYAETMKSIEKTIAHLEKEYL